MKSSFFICLFILLISNVHAQVGIGTVSPNSTLQVVGSFSATYRSFTTSSTASSTDHALVFTGTSAASLTLPDATACAGRLYLIKNASTSGITPVLTINTTSSQTIDGIATLLLSQAYQGVILLSNGANWNVSAQTASASSGTGWLLGGNSVSSIQNLGTTSNYDLPFITNNIEGMRLSAAGNFGIGTSTFNATYPEKLVVNAGTTTSVNAIVGKGSINNYLQLNIQNSNAGTNASSDVVATADNGTETVNYVDLGINSSANTSGIMGNANDAYLYTTGNNFLMGTANNNALVFMTGGQVQSANERMRISGTGNVGIGTNNPSYLLHVVASSNPLYLGGVQTGLSTDSVLTIINGVVRKISPSALATSSSNAWALVGNNNTLASNYFLGTTNTDPLIIKINSQLSGRIDAVNTFLGYQSGYNNSTIATQSTGIGYHALFANTSGTYNTAIGYNSLPNNSTGSNNIGIGYGADVGSNNTNSIAIGTSSYINSLDGIAFGASAQVFNTYGLAIGNNTYVGGTNGIAIGSGISTSKTQAQGTSSIAIGYNAYSGSTSSVAIGTGTNVTATNSVVIGNNSTTSQSNSIILGDATNNSLDVGIGTSSPSAKLHIYATTGNNPLLMQGVPTGSTTDNLLTINTSTGVVNSLPYSSFGTGWLLGGNSVSSIQNFGTTSNYDLPFITNNAEKMRLSATGNLGIGTSTFNATNPEKLVVNAGTTTSVNAIVGKGSINNYLQLNIQNSNAGANASSDVVATADNGTETVNYVDLGINSSVNTSGAMGNANDAYLYTTGNNFLMGTANNNALVFMTGGEVQSTNERMRISGTGNVGIGTNSPSQLLTVNGNFNLSGAFMPGGTAGTAGYFLVSSGAGVAPTWFNASSYAWLVNGNAVSSSSNTIGTTTAYDFPFITNNTERMRITSAGNLGLGTTAPTSTLQVNGSTAHSITSITATSTVTLDATYYTVVIMAAAGTITLNLPAASSCTGRIYVLVNKSGNTQNSSTYLDFAGNGTTSLLSHTSYTLQSNGTSWDRIQ